MQDFFAPWVWNAFAMLGIFWLISIVLFTIGWSTGLINCVTVEEGENEWL